MRKRVTGLALAAAVLGAGAWLLLDPRGFIAHGFSPVSVTFLGTRHDTNGLRVADFAVTNRSPHTILFALTAVHHTVPRFKDAGLWTNRPSAFPMGMARLDGYIFARVGHAKYSLRAPAEPGPHRVELSYVEFDVGAGASRTRLQALLRRLGMKNLSERLKPKPRYTVGEVVPLPPDVDL